MFPPVPTLERSCLSLRERWQRRKPLTERGNAERPEAVPYMQPAQSPSVTAPPEGEPRHVPACTCIGAVLPLPSGEVAMPQGIDGEG